MRRLVREGVSVPVADAASVAMMTPRAGATLQLCDLERAIGLLPEEQRQVILLIGREKPRHQEAAAVGRCSGRHGPLAVVARPGSASSLDRYEGGSANACRPSGEASKFRVPTPSGLR